MKNVPCCKIKIANFGVLTVCWNLCQIVDEQIGLYNTNHSNVKWNQAIINDFLVSHSVHPNEFV